MLADNFSYYGTHEPEGRRLGSDLLLAAAWFRQIEDDVLKRPSVLVSALSQHQQEILLSRPSYGVIGDRRRAPAREPPSPAPVAAPEELLARRIKALKANPNFWLSLHRAKEHVAKIDKIHDDVRATESTESGVSFIPELQSRVHECQEAHVARIKEKAATPRPKPWTIAQLPPDPFYADTCPALVPPQLVQSGLGSPPKKSSNGFNNEMALIKVPSPTSPSEEMSWTEQEMSVFSSNSPFDTDNTMFETTACQGDLSATGSPATGSPAKSNGCDALNRAPASPDFKSDSTNGKRDSFISLASTASSENDRHAGVIFGQSKQTNQTSSPALFHNKGYIAAPTDFTAYESAVWTLPSRQRASSTAACVVLSNGNASSKGRQVPKTRGRSTAGLTADVFVNRPTHSVDISKPVAGGAIVRRRTTKKKVNPIFPSPVPEGLYPLAESPCSKIVCYNVPFTGGPNALEPFYWTTEEYKNYYLQQRFAKFWKEDTDMCSSAATYPVAARPVHVFVDLSNIIIGFYNTMKSARGIPLNKRITPPMFEFKNLHTILSRHRTTAKQVVAGSVRRKVYADTAGLVQQAKWPEYMFQAQELGYEMNIKERVLKVASARRFRSSHGGARSGDSSSEDTYDPRPIVQGEEGVDENLHLKMLESIVDCAEPATIVLATGDANVAEYSGGFKLNVERALQKGWHVEVYSWSRSMSAAWRDAAFAQMGNRFRLIELDPYAEELFAEYVPYNRV